MRSRFDRHLFYAALRFTRPCNGAGVLRGSIGPPTRVYGLERWFLVLGGGVAQRSGVQ